MSQIHALASRLGRWCLFVRRAKQFAAKGPRYHYTYGRWRLRQWYGRDLSEIAALDDRSFFGHLDLDQPGLTAVKAAIAAGHDERAKTEIRAYFLGRRSPRFFFDEDDIHPTLAWISSAQKQATILAANDICQHRFCFRQSEPVAFEGQIDWTYQPQGNLDWTWDLNRHVFFETLGQAYWYTDNDQYAAVFSAILMDWLAQNPVKKTAANWSSVFEVGFRINTWVWAFHAFRSAPSFTTSLCITLLKGLFVHGHYLDAAIELHAQNNHLLLEAKSLAVLGLLFPEFKAARRWRHRGLDIVYREVRAQVCKDGVHGERATHYHRVIAGELLELLLLLDNNQLSAPPDITQAVERMMEFERWVTKPDGTPPLLCDSALEDTYLRLSASRGGPLFFNRPELSSPERPPGEAEIWRLGARRMTAVPEAPLGPLPLHSRAFADGGYFIMRQGDTVDSPYLVFDCGPFGYSPVPSHGHADALSFELYAHGQTVLVDPGIYSTHLGANWRNFFRGTRAHNTVVVDDLDQSELLDVWRVDRQAQTVLHHWMSRTHFDFVDGSHNGYERLREPINHRRQIFFAKPDYWIVVDWLSGQGKHCFDLYYHFMPDFEVELDEQSHLVRARGAQAALTVAPLLQDDLLQAEIMIAATDPIQGWVSVLSGEKRPAATLRYRRHARVPQQFCTLLYPHTAHACPSVKVAPLAMTCEPEASIIDLTNVIGLQIETEAYCDYLVLDRDHQSVSKHFAGYQAKGWLIYLRHDKKDGQLKKAIVRGALHLTSAGRSLVEQYSTDEHLIYDGESYS